MAEGDISLESILQKRSEPAAAKDPHGRSGAPVPLVLITYAATESAIRARSTRSWPTGLCGAAPVIRIERE
jgi:homoserine dehydrogenase